MTAVDTHTGEIVQSTDLVPTANMAALEALSPADQEAAVTRMLVESRSWLAHAMQSTEPAQIAQFKAYVATIAESTRQLGLAKDIQLDAQEMVRRAERGIGVAIRRGQEAGEIRAKGQNDGASEPFERVRLGHRETVVPPPRLTNRRSPGDFLTDGTNTVETYVMADATDEQFDEALSAARSEANVSRRNVVRKIRTAAPSSRDGVAADRYRKIADLASKGNTSRQISALLGYSEDGDTIRSIARREGIDIPADRLTPGSGRINPTRVIEQTVIELAGLATGIKAIDINGVDRERIQEWVSSLSESLRSLNRLKKELTHLDH